MKIADIHKHSCALAAVVFAYCFAVAAYAGVPFTTTRVAEIKEQAIGTDVCLDGAVVIAEPGVFDPIDTPARSATIYIEDADRASAIAVDLTGYQNTQTINRGDKLNITGQVATDSYGHKTIHAASIIIASPADQQIRPLGMLNKSIAYPNMCNSCLLVKVWGIVTSIDSASNHFMISDASTQSGVEVSFKNLLSPIDSLYIPNVGDYVSVTGIATNGLIRIREANDIATHACGGNWANQSSAAQQIYQQGVPHTDRYGRYMSAYNVNRSFFPLALYHASHLDMGNGIHGFSDLVVAGFNTVHMCGAGWWTNLATGQASQALPSAVQAGISILTTTPSNDDILAMKNSPAALGWYLTDEPENYPDQMETLFASFQQRYAEIKAIDPVHPVFALNGTWTISTQSGLQWWTRWSTTSDIACQDNYPVRSANLNTLSSPVGIPESVSLAASVNQYKKPVWFCAQTHYFQDPTWSCVQPTAAQERCMVYTAIIHGATGIIYFGMDSSVLRDGNCIGIAPDPKASYPSGISATADQILRSKELWNQVVRINSEITSLKPSILSSTASLNYEVYTDKTLPSITINPIRTLLKTDPAGGYNLLLVNIDSAPQRVRIRIPNTGFSVREKFANNTINKLPDEFSINCSGFDSRVFHISMNN